VVGLLGSEFFGLAATGLVVPGYLALHLHDRMALLATLSVAFAALGAIRGIATFTILHGRRRAAAMQVGPVAQPQPHDAAGEGVRREIGSMPGVFNLSVDEAVKEAAAAKADVAHETMVELRGLLSRAKNPSPRSLHRINQTCS
jgi:hypothetical protein